MTKKLKRHLKKKEDNAPNPSAADDAINYDNVEYFVSFAFHAREKHDQARLKKLNIFFAFLSFQKIYFSYSLLMLSRFELHPFYKYSQRNAI